MDKKQLCILALNKMLNNEPVKFNDDAINDYSIEGINVNYDYVIESINSNETVNLNGDNFYHEICVTELNLI
jgi:hypothetical protein